MLRVWWVVGVFGAWGLRAFGLFGRFRQRDKQNFNLKYFSCCLSIFFLFGAGAETELNELSLCPVVDPRRKEVISGTFMGASSKRVPGEGEGEGWEGGLVGKLRLMKAA